MSLSRRIANLFSRSKVEREIDAELRSHIEMRIEDNIAGGIIALLLCVAGIASFVPARRAALANPVDALRA
jgi:ABC-type lipoprotein release transport system permease subunit